MNELMNGNYWIYQLVDGGCGIVKANDSSEAYANVRDAYKGHDGTEYGALDIEIKNIADMGRAFFGDKVIEFGWTIEMN